MAMEQSKRDMDSKGGPKEGTPKDSAKDKKQMSPSKKKKC
jgi:hypothetical protein